MKKILLLEVIKLFCLFSICFSAQGENKKINVRLATIDEARDNTPPSMQLENYKLGPFLLGCDLPDGTLVEVTPVLDKSDFTFLSIRSKKGPLILANERFITEKDVLYGVFSFYRECALHAVTKVRTLGPGRNDTYDSDIINIAECLAVLPTKRTIGSSMPLSLSYIESRLYDEYGKGSSTRLQLNRCTSDDYVSKVIGRLPKIHK